MKVLHVALGLPPLRTGGLTRYSVDLMNAQVDSGYRVYLLYPGRFLPGKTVIKRHQHGDIGLCEVVNPLPVPLTCGVGEPQSFIAKCDNTEAYRKLLEQMNPDVVHVHSYQGIHREFFELLKMHCIPSVFTTHDYLPICPRATLVDRLGVSCDGPKPEKCASCCCDCGMTLMKSRIMQSHLYAVLKNSFLLRAVSRKVRKGMTSRSVDPTMKDGVSSPTEIASYRALLDYNSSILSMIDLIVSNSALTERIYREYFPDKTYLLVPGTHGGLVRNRPSAFKHDDADEFKYAYLGGRKAYKGYETLLGACKILHDEGVRFRLDLYGDDYEQPVGVPEAVSSGRVLPDEISGILRAHDIIVVPSICHETCGFVVLEALCEGVGVVCSDAVGASGLIDSKYVFRAGDARDLARKLEYSCAHRGAKFELPSDYPISMNNQTKRLEEAYAALIAAKKYDAE